MRNKRYASLAVLALFLMVGIFTGCGKKGQEDFEKGMAAYKSADFKTAIELFEKAANDGHAEAQYRLSCCYDDATGVDYNREEAFKWLRKSAENQYSVAMCDLARHSESGLGTEADESKAEEWFLKAAKALRKDAEKGNTNAMTELGWSYMSGKGVEKDEKEGVKWYQKAADLGNADAMCRLGVCYSEGKGVEKDQKKQFEWTKKAAENGNSTAMVALALLYKDGKGVEQNEKEAYRWKLKAIENGNSIASFAYLDDVLNFYFNEGVAALKEDDYDAAIDAFKIAGNLGSVGAYFNLGIIYIRKKQDPEALKYFLKAAEYGYPNAQYMVGVAYLEGKGTEKDVDEAKKWFEKAADQDHEGAIEVLRSLE